MTIRTPDDEGADFQPNWKKIGGVITLLLVVIATTAVVTWALAKDAYADSNRESGFGDLVTALDKNRLGVVVGATKEETCVNLLDDSFGPQDTPPVCTSNATILNFTDYDYGPSVLPALGDVYEIRYFSDRGVQEGLVFFPPGSAPQPDATPTVIPGVDVEPTATAEK